MNSSLTSVCKLSSKSAISFKYVLFEEFVFVEKDANSTAQPQFLHISAFSDETVVRTNANETYLAENGNSLKEKGHET